jgi:hypothetical protein
MAIRRRQAGEGATMESKSLENMGHHGKHIF